MKKVSLTLLTLSTMLCFIQVSCKKDDPKPALVASTSALLQNKNWKLTAGVISPALNGITDWYNNFLESCEQDDLFRFNTGNAFVLDEGASMCISGPQSQNGTWNYNENSKTLHFALNPPSDNYDLIITQINENSFTGNSKDTINGVIHSETWVFAKQ